MLASASKRLVTFWLPAMALVLLTFSAFAESHAEEDEPVATIEIKQWKVGFIIGGGGGSGELKYQGKSYPLDISGLRIGAVAGIAKADLFGDVYHLTEPKDIEGGYTAAEAAIAVGLGGDAWALKNEKGVVLKLSGSQKGIEIALDLSGMTITLKEQ